MGLSCLGCGETTEEGELCAACRASARRQTRALAAFMIFLVAAALLALVATS